MAWCIYEVELVDLAVISLISQTYGFCLDGDATFSFQLHAVEHLLSYLLPSHRASQLDESVGERRLAMVYMGNNAEIPSD